MKDSGDIVSKRKKRLHDLLGSAKYFKGGMVDEDDMEMSEMDIDEDDSMSFGDADSEVDPDSEQKKKKDRLLSLISPKFKRK